MGGFSSERHISVESGRNIYEKLSSSDKYTAIPIFLTGDAQEHLLYQLPINIMLKDNADDITEKVTNYSIDKHPVVAAIYEKTKAIREKFAYEGKIAFEKLTYDSLKDKIDFAFIALHGRPGEDGAVQEQLEKRDIAYNGSGVESSKISMNKFDTNERLGAEGILVAQHALVDAEDFMTDKAQTLGGIEDYFQYPFIAKPVDDGCSSAVKKIKNRAEFEAFCEMMFRPTKQFLEEPKRILKLKDSEEFPQKDCFLVEELISANGADKFLEITCGMIQREDEKGSTKFTVFEPSEALANGEILSLEEKFLAGEGQNITPARFADNHEEYKRIAKEVKNTLDTTARIINVEGYCRIDAFVRIYPDKVETVVIEINSLPGMTPATAIFHQSALNNMKPYEFIDGIIEVGLRKQKKQSV